MVFIEMEKVNMAHELQNLFAAILAKNSRGVHEELQKVIPKPQEQMSLEIIQAIFEIFKVIKNPILIEFFLVEFTKYIQEQGIQFEAVLYLAQQCAVLPTTETIRLFYTLMEAYPTAERYRKYFEKKK